jgi:4,5-dihydroxyphthalate decarboxylase
LARLRISIASWDYDRVRPIIDGRVPVEGCEVDFIVLPPEECFHRAYFNGEFDVSEIGFSPYLIAASRGISPYVALPVFLSRMFRHSAIYVRSDRGIRRPEDLRGRKIGVPEYQMSAAMWARGMLQEEFGVRPDEMQWHQGGLEIPGRKDKFPLNLPQGFPLHKIGAEETLAGLLREGRIDGLFSARAPSCYRDGRTPVARLFEDYETAEKDYFRRTGIFPIMHALGVRRDVHERHPWLAASLYKAFAAAKRLAQEDLFEVTALKIGLAWIASHAEHTRAVLGEDLWPYGVEANRTTLETMTRYSFEQGLAVRKLEVDELFARSTLEHTKV